MSEEVFKAIFTCWQMVITRVY